MILAVLLNGLWQGVALLAIAYLVAKAVPERSAATRCAIWLATLVALALVPLLSTLLPIALAAPAVWHDAASGSAYRISLIPAQAIAARANVWLASAAAALLWLWIAGVTLNLARLAVSFARTKGIQRGARPLEAGPSDVFISSAVGVPLVAGIRKPRIVLPATLPGAVSQTDLQRIVAHERAHIRRRDPLFNFVARLIEAVLFFNPWVRIAGACLVREREIACDDYVVAGGGENAEYARCLAALADSAFARRSPILTPSAFGSRSGLLARIKRLHSAAPRRLSINTFALGGIVMLFAIATLALQVLSPALGATPTAVVPLGNGKTATLIAAACANSDVEASVKNPAMPMLPHGAKVRGSTDVVVTISPSGAVTKTSMLHSSGNAAVDAAVVKAARQSTYSPKIVNCAPVAGSYVFHAQFQPGP